MSDRHSGIRRSESLLVQLRSEDPEALISYVQLHLSVVLEVSDLDELDRLCVGVKPAEKVELKRKSLLAWVRKRHRRSSSSTAAPSTASDGNCVSGNIFGVALSQEIIAQIFQLFSFLQRDDNMCQEGIFRKSGSVARQMELRRLLCQGVTVDLDSDRHFSVHDVAATVKVFLRELPQPLLTEPHLTVYRQICHFVRLEEMSKTEVMGARNKQLRALRLLMLLLPAENVGFLRDLLLLLKRIAAEKMKNRMDEANLGTIFAPLLFCSRTTDEEEFQKNCQPLAQLTALMIRNAEKVFMPPVDLIKDLEEHMRSKSADKGGLKNPFRRYTSNKTDMDGMKTQIRFVDPTRSAEANAKFSTETALAELYATVQMMPESSKKKKLIKQFQQYNRENNVGRVEVDNSRHLRTSLKRHIGQRLSGIGLSRRTSACRDSLTVRTPSQSSLQREGNWESRMSLLSSGSSLSSLGSLRSRNLSTISLGLSDLRENLTTDSGVMDPSVCSSTASLFDPDIVEISTPIILTVNKADQEELPYSKRLSTAPQLSNGTLEKKRKRRAPPPPDRDENLNFNKTINNLSSTKTDQVSFTDPDTRPISMKEFSGCWQERF